MKKTVAIILVLLMIACSSVSVGAITVYTDGEYDYADLDNGFVALYGCDDTVTDVTVKDAYAETYVSTIYEYCFFRNTNITSVDFSQAKHLNYIDTCAFSNCTNLSSEIALPSSVRFLGICAFENCSSIPSVTVGNSLKEIPAQCFNNCSALKRVVLSQNIERIGSMAFANCPVLEDIYIFDSVMEIDDTAFKNSEQVTIHCYKDSYAFQYALKHSLKLSIINNQSETSYTLGDADGDGSVNVSDVTRVQRYLAELETLEGIYLRAADANQDGTVDISDATALQMYIAEYDLPYPIGEVMTQ